MVGEPNLRSIATLRPLGPRVAETAFATTVMPFLSLRRASSENTICLAAIVILPFSYALGLCFRRRPRRRERRQEQHRQHNYPTIPRRSLSRMMSNFLPSIL